MTDIESFFSGKEDIGEGILKTAKSCPMERRILNTEKFFAVFGKVMRQTVDADACFPLHTACDVYTSEEALVTLLTAFYCALRANGTVMPVSFSLKEQRFVLQLILNGEAADNPLALNVDERVLDALSVIAGRVGAAFSISDTEITMSIPVYRAVTASTYIASEDGILLCVLRTLKDISSLCELGIRL